MRRQSALTTREAALAWLRDVVEESATVPTRLHVHQVNPSDLMGSPKMSAAFLHRLTDSPTAAVPFAREVECPARHPIRRAGDERCVMCDDTGSWMTTTDVYARPLAAAQLALRQARSRMTPHPRVVIEALIGADCDVARAARVLGWAPDDRRFLSAIRALYDVFSYTVIAPARAAA